MDTETNTAVENGNKQGDDLAKSNGQTTEEADTSNIEEQKNETEDASK